MQYKVPQNIDLEDRIVGPFTMKQFIYLLVSGGIIYGWWNYLQQGFDNFIPAFLLVAIPIGLLGFALAIVKVNDRPFEYFILSFIKFIFGPKQKRWMGGYQPEQVIVLDPAEKPKESENEKDSSSLDDVVKTLEQNSSNLRQQELAQKPQKSAQQIQAEGQKVDLSVKNIEKVAQAQTQAQAQGIK